MTTTQELTNEPRVATDSISQENIKGYRAIRNGAAIFDFCNHLIVQIEGDNASEELNRLITGNSDTLMDESSMYTAFCRDNGTILALSWIIRWEDSFYVITEPEQADTLCNHLFTLHNKNGVCVKDLRGKLGIVSLVGPNAQSILLKVIGDDILGLPYLSVEEFEISEKKIITSRIGNTGEFEYRMFTDIDNVKELTQYIYGTAIQENYDVECFDLSVLTIPFLEVKTINVSFDTRPETTLIEAGLHWMIDFLKTDFIGRDVLLSQIKNHDLMKAILLEIGCENIIGKDSVIELPGKGCVGYIQHCEYSPTYDRIIGLAYVNASLAWSGLKYYVRVGNECVEAVCKSMPLFETTTTKKLRE